MGEPVNQSANSAPLALQSVYIRKGNSQIFTWFDPTIPGQKLVGKYRVNGGRVDTIEISPEAKDAGKVRYFRFVTLFEFQYLLEKSNEPNVGDEDKLAAEIIAEIAINYVHTSKDEPSGELLEAWGKSSVMFHAWPYWREFCQSTLSRMSLPVVVLPLLDIPAISKPPHTD